MVSAESLLALTALLFVKHFFADGPLQTSHQVINKGRFLHPAGLTHAGVHAAGTALCLALWAPSAVGLEGLTAGVLLGFAGLLIGEFVIHYFIDFAKCQADARYRFSELREIDGGAPRLVINDTMFFMVFLLDQLAHALTLILIVYCIAGLV
ncbi:MAG: DUF3307 domain-containing protein [Pseudomonadota bacterium]